MNALRDRLRSVLRPGSDISATRVHRRRRLVSKINTNLPLLRAALFLIGYAWMLVIPSSRLGRCTYHDENALQPGQVNTNWNWGEVHSADRYLEGLEALRDQNATSELRARHIKEEFGKLGLFSSTQAYEFVTSNGTISGTNSYAILSSPRTSGAEAMVVSASWLSRSGEGDGTVNLRGVSTILALAKFLKRYSHWSKDIIFVVSDGYLDGMQAWVTQYHGVSQSNLRAEPLDLGSGVIWTALNIDYPGHSFSHLGIFFEGVNGRLPNQDLINSFKHIAQTTGGVPVSLYDHIDFRDHPDRIEEELIPNWVPETIRRDHELQTYVYHARNIFRHAQYQSRGRPSGVHGLFHQFRIDAITIFGIPSTGPHGFHAIGRIVESTMRTMNNLLERLHASFFFYILAGANSNRHRFPSYSHFLKIGSYLPSAVLISVAMMFGGLKIWTDAGWMRRESSSKETEDHAQWTRRHRPVLQVLVIMAFTHALGGMLFWLLRSGIFPLHSVAFFLFAIGFGGLPAAASFFFTSSNKDAPTSSVLKALNLCLASTVISVTTVVNFSLAAGLSIALGIPLSVSFRGTSRPGNVSQYFIYAALATIWLTMAPGLTRQAIWDWEVLGVWFAPILSIIYYPLVMQAALVSLL